MSLDAASLGPPFRLLPVGPDSSFLGVAVSPQDAWAAALGRLQLQMTPAAYETWLRDTRCLAAEDGTFLIAVPNAYARDWLECRLAGHIKRILGSLVGRSVELRFTVQSPRRETTAAPGPLWASQEAPAPAAVPGLNPRFSLQSFVAGPSNQLAFSAASAVAAASSTTYNPLYLYGDTGLGKTHLLQAIGRPAAARGAQVLYAPAETFTNDLIAAIRAQTTEAFRRKYRSVDLLLLDDVQFLAGKKRTEEEFLHTFNALQGAQRQVIITSDRAPGALLGLGDPLRSRLAGGLIVDVQPPDGPTRLAILRAKARDLGAVLPEEALAALAAWPAPSIRDLEGALRRLIAFARAHHLSLSADLVRQVLGELHPSRRPAAPDAVLAAVGAHFAFSPVDLRSRRRARPLALARHVAMYLLREDAAASLSQIGSLVGGRDHSTVLHACQKIEALLANDPSLCGSVSRIRQALLAP